MKQISITRKLVSGVAILSLLLAGGLIGQSSSQAAGLPTIRYVSPDFNAANETFKHFAHVFEKEKADTV